MSDDEKIKLLRNSYYNAIRLLFCSKETEQEIIECLPETTTIYFFPIMDGLLKKLAEDKESLLLLQSECTNLDDKEELQIEIDSCNYKILLCKRLYQEALEKIDTKTKAQKTTKNLIFATSAAGNIFIERDISSKIPEEYYQAILECFETIENGDMINNTKLKPLINNSQLNGIYEAKEFKIRVCFRILSSNCVYVFIVKMKKSDRDASDIKAIIERAKNVDDEFNYLKKAIKDEDFKQRIIEEHIAIKEKIVEQLKRQKRS